MMTRFIRAPATRISLTPLTLLALFLALLTSLPVTLTVELFEKQTAEIRCPREIMGFWRFQRDDIYPTVLFDDMDYGTMVLWKSSSVIHSKPQGACRDKRIKKYQMTRCLELTGNITRDTVQGTISYHPATLLRFTITAHLPDDGGRLYCGHRGVIFSQPPMTRKEKALTSTWLTVKETKRRF